MPELSDEELDIPEGLDPNIRAELRKSRTREKEAREATAEAESAKRELAFFKAGIPDAGIGELFRKAYDGPMDAESLKTAATAYGIGVDGKASENPEAEALAELERERQMQQTEGGQVPFKPEAKAEFVKQATSIYDDVLNNRMSVDEGARRYWELIDQKGPPAGLRRHIQD